MYKKFLISFLLFLLFKNCSFSDEVIKNISSQNKIYYQKKLKELQKIEFWGRRRGRAQVKPATISQFLIIQKLINQEKEILQQITLSYVNSKRQIEEITQKFSYLIEKEKISEVYQIGNSNLLKVYDLEEAINKCKSFLELFRTLNQTKFILSIIPQQYYLSLKAVGEIDKLSYPEENKGIEEVVNLFKSIPQSEDILDLEGNFSNFIKNLSEIESRYAKEILPKEETKEKEITTEEIPGKILTYTIRTNDGLIILYATEEAIKKVKEIIEGLSFVFLEKDELVKKIKGSKITGIKNIELFEKEEKREKGKINSTTLRGAIMENVLPIIEGLEVNQAEKILKAFNWEAYFINDENEIKNKLEEISQREEAKVVILTGLQKDSQVIWGIW